MNTKLFKIASTFVFAWVLGEVCQAPHSENVAFSLMCAFSMFVWVLDMQDIKKTMIKMHLIKAKI